MAKTRDYMDYLDERIEMAPANSQEEYQAAETIAEVLRDHDLETSVEEFETHPMSAMVVPVLSCIMFICLLVGGLTEGAVQIIMIVLAAVCAALPLVVHFTGINLFENLGPASQSQNVVALHRATGDKVVKGARPIVVVAHYDTPRESLLRRAPLARYQAAVRIATIPCTMAVAVSLLFQIMLFLPGFIRTFMWVLGLMAALPLLALAVVDVIDRFSACTVGANDNKSSVAALLSLASRVRPTGDRVDGTDAGEQQRRPARRRTTDVPPEPPAPRRVEIVEEVKGVRHGAEVLAALHILPPSCEVVYQEPRVQVVEQTPTEVIGVPVHEDEGMQEQVPESGAQREQELDRDVERDERAEGRDDWADEPESGAEEAPAVADELPETPVGDLSDYEESETSPYDDMPFGDEDEVPAGDEEDEYGQDEFEDADEDFDGDEDDETFDEDEFADDYDEEYDEDDYEDDEEWESSAMLSSVSSWFSERIANVRDFFSRERGSDIEIDRGEDRRSKEDEPDEYDEWIDSDDEADEWIEQEDEQEDAESGESEGTEALEEAEDEDAEAGEEVFEEDFEDDEADEVEVEDQDEWIDQDALEDEEAYEFEEESTEEDEDTPLFAALPTIEEEEEDVSEDEAAEGEAGEDFEDTFEEEYADFEYEDEDFDVEDVEGDFEEEYEDEEEYEEYEEAAQEHRGVGGFFANLFNKIRSAPADESLEPANDFEYTPGEPFEGEYEEYEAYEDEDYGYEDEEYEAEEYEDEPYESEDAEDEDAYDYDDAEPYEDEGVEEEYEEAYDYDDGEFVEDELEFEDEIDYEDEDPEEQAEPLPDPNVLHFDREEDADILERDTTGLDMISDSYDLYTGEVSRVSQREKPEPIGDPNWGTSTYQPAQPVINIARRAALFDLPDPSAASIDPFADDYEEYEDEAEYAYEDADAAAEEYDDYEGYEEYDEYEDEQPVQDTEPELIDPDSEDESVHDGSTSTKFWGSNRTSDWKGGAAVRSDLRDADEPIVMDADELQDAILEMGDEFLVSHDIWFVATGASEAGHAGIRSFIDEHRRDIRGAFLINLDSIGAGGLSVLVREGLHSPRRADRRLVRMVTGIAQDLHIQMDTAMYNWDERESATAMRARVRSVTIAGLDENDLPALSHTSQDVPENVDPKQVSNVVRIVSELIRRS